MSSEEEREENKGVESLKNFERALGHVRNSVHPLTQVSREEVGNCISAADRAKLSLQVAYGVSSLFYMLLKTQGVSPSSHPVKAELDRIREYFGRLKRAGEPPKQRTLKVDAEASRRFINAALSGDNVWQSAKSTDSKNAQQKRAAAGIGRSNPAGQPEMRSNTLEAAAAAAMLKKKSAKQKRAEASSERSNPVGQSKVRRNTPEKAAVVATQAERRRATPGGDKAKRQQQGQQQSLSAPGSAGSKRKHASAETGGAAGAVGDGNGKKSGGGREPKVATPGGSPRAVKKAKGPGGKKKKKGVEHRSW